MSVGVTKDYKLKVRNLHASHNWVGLGKRKNKIEKIEENKKISRKCLFREGFPWRRA
jgi:hypothetical protein